MAPRPPPKKPKQRQNAAKTTPATATPAVPYPKRLDRETDAAYASLCTYLAAGPDRSIRSVFGEARRRHAQDWSARYDWQARAAAWDAAVRDARLAAIQEAQRETDLATAEADTRVSRLARAALLSDVEPPAEGMGLIIDLYRLARSADRDASRLQAIQSLVDLAGLRDLRKLRHHRATAPTPPPPPPALLTPDVVAAIEAHASDGQLDDLSGGPLVDDPPEEPADADG